MSKTLVPALALLFLIGAGGAFADSHTYSTGSSAATLTSALANGDSVALSGSAGAITLSDGTTLTVSDWVRANAQFTLDTKTDITFAAAGCDWAVLQTAATGNTGRVFRLTASSAGNTLNLDHVILTGVTGAPTVETSGGAAALMTIGGPVVFHDNIAPVAGGGVRAASSLEFLDDVIFDQNRAGLDASTGAWALTSYGGAVAMMTAHASAIFRGSALFTSNTAAFSGGAFYRPLGSNALIFEKSVTFSNNYAGASGAANSNGGGIFFNGPAASDSGTIVFRGDATFLANSAFNGGGIHAPGAGNVFIFEGDVTFSDNRARTGNGGALNASGALVTITPGAAHTVTFTDNSAADSGGAIYSGNANLGVVVNAGKFFLTNNTAAADTGFGGGIRTSGTLAITGTFDISGNSAAFGGAAAARVVDIRGTGTFFNNTATERGGALYLTGSSGASGIRLLLTATGGDIRFTANTGTGAAVYFDTASPGAAMVLDAEAGCAIRFDDPVFYGIGKILTVTKNGAGAVVFDRYYSEAAANTTVNAGVFALTNSATWSRITGNTFTLTATGTLAGDGIVRSGNVTFADGSHLQAWDNGTLAIDATTRNYGSNLKLSGAGTISAGASLHATLVTAGLSHAGVDITSGAQPAGTLLDTTGTLVLLDNLTLASGGTLALDLDSADADLIRVNGDLNLDGTAVIDLGILATGSFNLVNWTGAGISSTTELTLTMNNAAPTPRADAVLGVDTATKNLYVTNTTYGLSLRWTGADAASTGGIAIWSESPAVNANFADLTTGPGGGTETHFRAGDSVIFDGDVPVAAHIAPGGVTASEITIAATGAVTFAGEGSLVTDAASASADFRLVGTDTTGKLIVTAPGNLVLANTATNIFYGGIEINGGFVQFQNPANKILGGVIMNGGTLSIMTAAQLDTTGAEIFFQGDGHILLTQSIPDTAPLTQRFTVAPAALATFEVAAFSSTAAFAGAMEGTGTYAKTGPGTLRLLTSANTADFSGMTRVDEGTLSLASGAVLGGSLNIGSGAQAGGSGTFAGNVAVADGGILQAGSTLTIGGNLTLDGNAAVQFNIYSGDASDQLILASGTGALVAAAANIVSIYGDIQTGTYFLGNAVNLADVGATLKINGDLFDSSLRFGASLDKTDTGDTLIFTYEADTSRYMDWIAGTGTWNASLDNWADYEGGIGASIAGKTKFQARDTVRIIGDADATLTLADATHVSDIIVENTAGTLTLAGASLTTGTAINGTLIVAPAAKLTKLGAGTLLLANASNTIIGGIDFLEGELAFSTAAQLGAAPITANAGNGTSPILRPLEDLTLANLITLASAAGTVSQVPSLSLDLPSPRTLTLTGTLAGTGVLAKTGDGTLIYTNLTLDGAAPNTLATRIDAGVLQLRFTGTGSDATAPANFAHTIILNGGWLDLSDPASAQFTGTDPLADNSNDWTSLNIDTFDGSGTGALLEGGVIGANDVVTLGSGEVTYAIGGATAQEKALYVRIAAGAGTTTFTTANTYAGRTFIESGVLAITADDQLGDTALARDVILAGGTLALNADFTTTRRVELAGTGGAIMLADGVTASLAGSVGTVPAAALEISGAGALSLTAPLSHIGETTLVSGTLRAPAEYLPGFLRLADAGTLVFEQPSDTTFTGTIVPVASTGDGIVQKTGTATLLLAPNSSLAAREIHIDAGAFVLTPAATLHAAQLLRVAPGAMLAGTGTVALSPGARLANDGEIRVGHAAGAAGYGTLTISGNYESASGALYLDVGGLASDGVQSDRFVVTGAVSGTTRVHFHQDAPQRAFPTGYALPNDIIAFTDATPGAFIQEGPGPIYGGTEYIWQQTGPDSGIWRTTTTTEVDAATGADAAALLAGKTAAASLADRLDALRLTPSEKSGAILWADALHRYDKLRGSVYNEARSTLYGIQTGVAYRLGIGNRALTAGLFADYVTTDFDQTAGRVTARAENNAAGVCAMLHDAAWHIEILARSSVEKYKVAPAAGPEFRIKGAGALQQISAGLVIHEFRDWHFEPQLSLSHQRVKLDSAESPSGLTYDFDPAESLEARAAFRLWAEHTRKNGLVVRPSFRAAILYDFKGRSVFDVNGQRFESDLGGAAGQVDMALALQLTRHLDFNAAVAYLFGSKYESYNITAGLALRW